MVFRTTEHQLSQEEEFIGWCGWNGVFYERCVFQRKYWLYLCISDVDDYQFGVYTEFYLPNESEFIYLMWKQYKLLEFVEIMCVCDFERWEQKMMTIPLLNA